MIATTMNIESGHFEIKNAVALVTGANRGIGRAYAERLAQAGAARIYAGARDLSSLGDLIATYPAIVPVYLDVTDPQSIAEAASRARDLNLLINNAGIARRGGVIAPESLDGAREEMDVNYFGLLQTSRAFAPVLAANAPAAIVNVLSILSLMGIPRSGTYSASKAAALAATRTIRAELRAKGVHVLGVMPGYVDTDMTAGLDGDKMTADEVVRESFAALERGDEEVYPGALATTISRAFFTDYKALETQLAG